jgi:SpoVK/Ycf46/Vps4 family AAA+-type ATPase
MFGFSPRLFSKYVGDTELAIREVFASARKLAPCVVFIDEIDSVGAKRHDEQVDAHDRALSTLLNEIDGVEMRSSVFVIGCTNRPDLLDSALIRPGRLDRLIYLGLPTAEDRKEMILLMAESMPILLNEEDLDWLVGRTENYSFAELKSVCREAAMNALRADVNAISITKTNFLAALLRVPSIPKQTDVFTRFSMLSK